MYVYSYLFIILQRQLQLHFASVFIHIIMHIYNYCTNHEWLYGVCYARCYSIEVRLTTFWLSVCPSVLFCLSLMHTDTRTHAQPRICAMHVATCTNTTHSLQADKQTCVQDRLMQAYSNAYGYNFSYINFVELMYAFHVSWMFYNFPFHINDDQLLPACVQGGYSHPEAWEYPSWCDICRLGQDFHNQLLATQN